MTHTHTCVKQISEYGISSATNFRSHGDWPYVSEHKSSLLMTNDDLRPSRCTSVRIVSDYELDDRAIRV
jgi:hypothetical protein